MDEAHGAHFGFHSYFPENAVAKGADVVIHSLHKTLPSPTQTALLHMSGTYADRKKVRNYLDILQSSSPSYILMAGIDACVDALAHRREEMFMPYVSRLKELRGELKKLKYLRLVETDAEFYDPSKLVISVADTDLSGRELYEILLKEYHLQMEMAAGTYVLAMTSVGDTEEGFARFRDALFSIDRRQAERVENGEVLDKDDLSRRNISGRLPVAERVYTSYETEEISERISLLWKEAEGCISAEYAYLYPPGIPLIVPGERVTEEITDILRSYSDLGFSIEGLKEEGYMEVLING